MSISSRGLLAEAARTGALHAEIAGGSKMVTLINRFTLTASPEKF